VAKLYQNPAIAPRPNFWTSSDVKDGRSGANMARRRGSDAGESRIRPVGRILENTVNFLALHYALIPRKFLCSNFDQGIRKVSQTRLRSVVNRPNFKARTRKCKLEPEFDSTNRLEKAQSYEFPI